MTATLNRMRDCRQWMDNKWSNPELQYRGGSHRRAGDFSVIEDETELSGVAQTLGLEPKTYVTLIRNLHLPAWLQIYHYKITKAEHSGTSEFRRSFNSIILAQNNKRSNTYFKYFTFNVDNNFFNIFFDISAEHTGRNVFGTYMDFSLASWVLWVVRGLQRSKMLAEG